MAKKSPQINASSMADISFLLLIFFLVTTSMDVNKGLARRLPPPPDNEKKLVDTEIKKRNILEVKINEANRLMVKMDGDVVDGVDINNLRDKVKEFVKNEKGLETMPELRDTTFSAPLGTISYTKNHVISVQNSVETRYQDYLMVQNEIVAAYNELREEIAQAKFHKHYDDLTDKQQKDIQVIYHMNISEAEPKNYN